MCIFSGKVQHVGDTKIFARLKDELQYLVYEMSVQAQKEVAMILPLPVSTHAEDAVKFISLEEYPKFFKDMAKSFERATKSLGSRSIGCASFSPLVVHDVGDFIASFVPNRASFLRLDQVFRLPDEAWNALPDYSEYGYAVFQLKPGKKQDIHPMAFSFPTRHNNKLFFPTVHLHDGRFHETELFDHTIYWQGQHIKSPRYVERSNANLRQFVNEEKSKGIIAGNELGYQMHYNGRLPNEDILLELA